MKSPTSPKRHGLPNLARRRRNFAVWGGTIALGIAATGALAEPIGKDPETVRLDKEAKLLFAVVMKDRDTPLTTCELAASWGHYDVSYEIAHPALGLEVHANLENPDDVDDPAAIIGPAAPKDAFCGDMARSAYEKGRVEAWQAAFRALPKDAKRPTPPSFAKWSFSFPAFDRTFQRAVVVREGDVASLSFDDKGAQQGTVYQGGRTALVYARDGEGWQKVEEINLFSSD